MIGTSVMKKLFGKIFKCRVNDYKDGEVRSTLVGRCIGFSFASWKIQMIQVIFELFFLSQNLNFIFSDTLSRLKKYLASQRKLQKKCLRPGKRLFYQQYFPGTSYMTQMDLEYSTKLSKTIISKSNFAQVIKIAMCGSLAWMNPTTLVEKFQSLLSKQ